MLEEEMKRQDMENKAKNFLADYRRLCETYGMEFSVEQPKFVIVEKSYEGDKTNLISA